MPEYLLFLLPLLFFGVRGAELWRKIARNRRLLRGWQDAAGACGLQILETSAWGPRLQAGAGPVAVTIDGCESKGEDLRIDVRIPGSPELYKVSIRREPLVRRAGDLEIGDPRFDRAFFVEGPMRLVRALLDAETRRLLIRANAEGRLQISTDTLRVENMPDEQVPHVLPLLLDIGRRFVQPIDIAQRLAENANRDPEAGVRLQNLLVLLRELPEAPEAIEALRAACADPSPEIRLQAAKRLGAGGRDLLLDLAESLVDDAVSAEAVSTLDRELTFERTKAILDQALEKGRARTARACLEALGRLPGASPGQLSIAGAETEAGQLSLAASEIGQLSLASAETGRLALAVEPFPLAPEETARPAERGREGPAGQPV